MPLCADSLTHCTAAAPTCAPLELSSFATHQVYEDKLLEALATAAARELSVSVDAVMEQCGEYFITFVGRYGYDSVLKVLGRHLRDFLNGLDNLHAYLRFATLHSLFTQRLLSAHVCSLQLYSHMDAQVHVSASDVAVVLLRERVKDGPDAAVLLGAAWTAPLHQRPNTEDRVRVLWHRPAHTNHLAVRERKPHKRDL